MSNITGKRVGKIIKMSHKYNKLKNHNKLMKSVEQLKKLQDKLDEQVAKCIKCGQEDKWGFMREYGGQCGDCIGKDMQEHSKKLEEELKRSENNNKEQ